MAMPDACLQPPSSKPSPAPGQATRGGADAAPVASLRLEHDLQAVVLLVLEQVVAPGRVGEGDPVGDDEARVDLALEDPVEQRLHVPLNVALAALDREAPVHHCPDR